MPLAEYGEWVFGSGGGVSVGFNDAALDTFQGHGVNSMVREIIQNSADARADFSKPTHVAFSIFTIPRNEADEITSLALWLERGWDADPPGSNDDDVAAQRHDFYRAALKNLSGDSIQVLAVHDFNTTGLTGATTFQPGHTGGPWWALVRSTGRNTKANAGAGGSYGHGSKAPIAFSGLRSVFYFTEYEEDDQLVLRFQGKSILESMGHPQFNDQFTSNTGFFATGEADGNPQPLSNEFIPDWVTRDRRRFGSGFGTSVFVPLPQFQSEDDFWGRARTSLVGNFAPALLDGQLRVEFGGKETVDQNSVQEAFAAIHREGLDDMTQEQLESAETVLRGTRQNVEWPNIGRVDYFSRQGEGLKARRVGIARSLGMLITRRMDGLGPGAQYGGTEPFDLFVWIRGSEGNGLLRSLENPEHNAFELDRIKDTDKQATAKQRFNALKAEIRKLAAEKFGIHVSSRLPLGDLDFLLSDNSLTDNSPEAETGAEAPGISPLHKPVSPASGGNRKKKGSKKAQPAGRKPPRGQKGALDGDGADVERNELIADGFRIVPSGTHRRRATVHINTPSSEYRSLEIYRAGETVVGETPCMVKVVSQPGSPAQRIPLELNGAKNRISLAVEFADEQDLHGPSRLVGVLR